MAAKDQLITHLRDTHALEEKSIKQLERAVGILDDDELKDGYSEHLEQTHEHAKKIKERLEAHDLEPSAVQDLTMRSGAIGLRQLADIPPDTPVKLAMHFYAFEHLEISTYELLKRIAKEADDNDTAEVAEQILEEERQAAEKVESTFDRAAQLLLESHASEKSKDKEESSEEKEESSEEKEESPKDEEKSRESKAESSEEKEESPEDEEKSRQSKAESSEDKEGASEEDEEQASQEPERSGAAH